MTKFPRKSRCKFAMLPVTIRTEVNRKLRDGWYYATIVGWLFDQKVEQEIPDLKLQVGDAYSLAWTRTAKSKEMAHILCKTSLATWFRTGYCDWLKDEVREDKTIRVLKEMEVLSSVANENAEPESKEGGNLLIRSLLLDTLKLLHEEKADPEELAQLANAWARLNQTATENEKIKLRTQDSIDAGLEALKAEITKDPETVELFKKLHDIVKGSRKPTA
jgi:hypothetical protein